LLERLSPAPSHFALRERARRALRS
jgi:hypothetical protein